MILMVIAAQTKVLLTATVTIPADPYGDIFVMGQGPSLDVPDCMVHSENGEAILPATTMSQRTEKNSFMRK